MTKFLIVPTEHDQPPPTGVVHIRLVYTRELQVVGLMLQSRLSGGLKDSVIQAWDKGEISILPGPRDLKPGQYEDLSKKINPLGKKVDKIY